jgi:hypothetical protein
VSASKLWRSTLLLALVALCAGCGDKTRSVTAYEPGVYKGAKDPLLEMESTPEQKARLKERFTQGQTDR